MFQLTLPQSPRALHRLVVVRAIAASSMLVGCVEATAYEQATSAAEVQAEARRRLSERHDEQTAELERARAERDRLRTENARLLAQLTERDGAVDQAKLDLVLAKQETTEGASLVQQLRGDLARVGSHMDVVAAEKAGLGSELEVARQEKAKLEAELSLLKAAPKVEAAPSAEPSEPLADEEGAVPPPPAPVAEAD